MNQQNLIIFNFLVFYKNYYAYSKKNYYYFILFLILIFIIINFILELVQHSLFKEQKSMMIIHYQLLNLIYLIIIILQLAFLILINNYQARKRNYQKLWIKVFIVHQFSSELWINVFILYQSFMDLLKISLDLVFFMVYQYIKASKNVQQAQAIPLLQVLYLVKVLTVIQFT